MCKFLLNKSFELCKDILPLLSRFSSSQRRIAQSQYIISPIYLPIYQPLSDILPYFIFFYFGVSVLSLFLHVVWRRNQVNPCRHACLQVLSYILILVLDALFFSGPIVDSYCRLY